MSDTHSLTPHIKFDVPDGDVFIHAGDFTRCGSLEEVVEFNEWIGMSSCVISNQQASLLHFHVDSLHISEPLFFTGKLPHKYKVVIAGNHELSFDGTFTKAHGGGDSLASRIPTLGLPRDAIAEAVRTPNTKQYLTNCIYLQDEAIVIFGIKIYGTPW